MKHPSVPLRRAALAAIGCSVALVTHSSAIGDGETARIYESYDNNPTGPMVGTTVPGYGLSGVYVSTGTADSAAFQIVENGLEFGTFNPAGGKCVQVNAVAATGVGAYVEGGKNAGDGGVFGAYSKLYCSYLVKHENNANGKLTANVGRAEVRIANGPGGGDARFQLATDRGTAESLQPGLGYRDVFGLARPIAGTTPLKNIEGDLVVGTTYMIIGKFENVGNTASFTTTASYLAGVNTINATGTNFNSLEVGQLITGTGIPAGRVISAINYDTKVITLKDGAVTTAASGAIPSGGTAPANATLTVLSPEVSTTGTWTTATTNTISVTSTTGLYINQAAYALNAGTLSVTGSIVAIDAASKIVTLNSTPTAAGTNAPIFFMRPTNIARMFALTLAQYNHFMASSSVVVGGQPGGNGLDSYLEKANENPSRIGPAAHQISLALFNTYAGSASTIFRQGVAVALVAQGSTTTSPQKYKMDELRYGMTLRTVTKPTPYTPRPAGSMEVVDNFSEAFGEFFYYDTGYGWKGGYYEVTEGPSGPTGAYGVLTNTSLPLTPGSGPYLGINFINTSSADEGLRRKPDPAVVNMALPHTINFDFRFDTGIGTFGSFSDRIHIGGDSDTAKPGDNNTSYAAPALNGGPVGADAANGVTWLVGAVGGNESNRQVYPKHWYFFNNRGVPLNISTTGGTTNTAFYSNNMVDTGMVIEKDVTYSFQIEVDPAVGYKATITNRTTNVSYTYPDPNRTPAPAIPEKLMTFRWPTAGPSATTLFFGGSKPVNDERAFGLDNLVIKQGLPITDTYVAWSNSTAFPVAATTTDRARSFDYDKDGRPNFLEFAIDGNPASGANDGKVRSAISPISGSDYQTLTLPVRTGVTFSGTGPLVSTAVDQITYTVQGSYDLVNWTAPVVELASPITFTPALPALNTTPGWGYKSFRLSATTAAQPKGFLRVVVNNTATP